MDDGVDIGAQRQKAVVRVVEQIQDLYVVDQVAVAVLVRDVDEREGVTLPKRRQNQ